MAALSEGMKAPSFKCKTQDDEFVQLKDYKGQTVVLYFYPKDLTPGCTIEAKNFQSELGRFKKKNAVIVGVSRDDQAKHEKFACKFDLKFPLLADEDGKVCEAFGVWQQKKFMGKSYMGIVRSTFIIGPDGKIAKIFDKVKVKGHVEEVLASI